MSLTHISHCGSFGQLLSRGSVDLFDEVGHDSWRHNPVGSSKSKIWTLGERKQIPTAQVTATQ